MVPVSPDKESKLEVIHHLFLPRNLPQCKEKDLNSLEHKILGLAFHAICKENHHKTSLASLIPKTAVLISTWRDVQKYLENVENEDSEKIQKRLEHMKPGETLAMYIANQNAGLLFSIPPNDSTKVIVSSFQASCSSQSVMSSEKDLLVQIPEQSVITPKSDLFHSLEFSNLLVTLATTELQMALPKSKKAGQEYDESRDVADPMFVTEWITSLLAVTGSRTSTEQEFPRVIKKIRDDVIYKSGKNYPWRRSGLWLTVKAAIQLSLTLELGQELGTHLYKIIILKVLLQTFKEVDFDPEDVSRWDIRMEMMAKMARRIEKLKLRHPEKSLITSVQKLSINGHNAASHKETAIRKIQSELFKEIEEAMKSARSEMDGLWNQINSPTLIKKICVTPEQLRNSTHHLKLQKLLNYVEQRKRVQTSNPNPSINNPDILPRLQNSSPRSFLQLHKNRKHLHEIDFLLYEIENWIQTQLTAFYNPFHVRELAIEYSELASEQYKQDPLAFSNMILTVLKCLKALDELATQEFPLLKEYACGLNLSVFENLLIPTAEGMKLAHEIEVYFTQRDAQARFCSSLISENEPKAESFGVRLAQQKGAMQDYRNRIVYEMGKQVQDKLREVETVKAEVIRQQAINNSYAVCPLQYNTKRSKSHLKRCQKCVARRKALHLETSVKPYERIFPLDPVMQNAIVFDLMIPQSIASLRDLLQFFSVELCSETAEDKCISIWKEWKDYDPLVLNNHSLSTAGRIVFLASTQKLGDESHYSGVKKQFQVSRDLPESFILNNGMNTRYHNKAPILKGHRGMFKPSCTFRIDSKEDNFKGMQWAIDDSTHTSNEAIAKQSQCPQGLTVPEFVQLGSLRSGNRLQYRNIFLGLSNGMLPIQSEPVYQLICEAQWQLGPRFPGTWRRDSHQDFSIDFSSEFLNLITQLVEKNKENWSEPWALLSLIAISNRIRELSPNLEIRSQASLLLTLCRNIGYRWMNRIRQLRHEMNFESEEIRSQVTRNLIDAALACCMTFTDGLPSGEETKSLEIWLHSISCLYEEVIQDKIVTLLTPTRQSILRNILTQISSKVEMQASRVVLRIQVQTALSNFLGKRCKDYGKNRVWTWDNMNNGFFKCNVTSQSQATNNHIVSVDLRFGRFLVDGYPVGKLPDNIINHQVYQRVFAKFKFSVQKDKFNTFTTTGEFNEKLYSFQLLNNSDLIVKEINIKNGTSYELIPETFFQENLPHNLEHECSHWWNIQSQQEIQFRPLSFQDEAFQSASKYILNLMSLKITDQNNKSLVSRTSDLFAHLTVPLQKIEEIKFFNVWITNSSIHSASVIDSLRISLVRLGLQFKLQNGLLISHEYPESVVAENQSIGTLVGLQNVLVLSEKEISPHIKPVRKLIVPHGNLKIERSSSLNHQQVSIECSELLRSPRYFVYEMDDRMRILKAERSQSAWIYLAALHGATSSPLPDIFTGLTGTEMSFEILQSARCWSCQPYDNEALETLQMIEKFTPKRNFYPSHMKSMQQVSWPIGLPSACAHEGYALIVDKLRNDSTELSPLFNNLKEVANKEICKKQEGQMELMVKHYRRQMILSSPSATIKNRFDINLFSRVNSPVGSLYVRQSLLNKSTEVTRQIRLISELFQSQHFNLELQSSHYLQQWIISGRELNCSRYDTEANFTDFNLTFWADKKYWEEKNYLLRHQWLHLYKLAKSVKQTKRLIDWQILLSSLLMNGEVKLHEVLLLQTIAMKPQAFPKIDFEINSGFSCPNEDYSSTVIKEIFVQNQHPQNPPSVTPLWSSLSLYQQQDQLAELKLLKEKHERKVNEEADLCENRVRANYGHRTEPRISWLSQDLENSVPNINLHRSNDQIETCLLRWRRNRRLREFLAAVEASILKVKTLLGFPIPQPTPFEKFFKIISPRKVEQFNEFQESPDYKISQETLKAIIRIFDAGTLNLSENRLTETNLVDLESSLTCIQAKFIKVVSGYVEIYLNPPSTRCLKLSGLYHKSVPAIFLPLLVQGKRRPTAEILVGGLAVLWTLEQKIIRCIRYIKAGDSMKVALEREIKTKNHDGWNPRNHPEWLLLELEMDMMIRPMQLATAKEMLHPSGNKNSVMQLNCGEGKTSLIVPMVAVAVTGNKLKPSSLCRITVLRSIFETNYNSLKYTLGGILNRKIYTIPCRRDIHLNCEMVEKIQSVLEECVQQQGVLLTVPEHRLSFQLKGYEMSLRKEVSDAEIAKKLIETQLWLNSHARDILDESDELLSAKYQLVYTIGEHQSLDGGDIRWLVSQSLLKLLPKRMKELNDELGDSCIEFQASNSAEIFPRSCRLLSKESYGTLISKLAEDCLDGCIPEFPKVTMFRPLIKRFLTDESVTEDIHQMILDEFKQNNERKYEILLILGGYLKGQVLLKALTKRWRVNYGVDPNGRKRVAVPFRAKDVATERTEFGHADMAIILTQLSYYYSGLNEKQLRECFKCLSQRRKCRSPHEIYEEWIQAIPKEKLKDIPLSTQSFSGVNLQDYKQWSKEVFPILSKSMVVIDFWLNSVVYPKECKQYPNKIACTAYDLCAKKSMLTTGFSGTNDSRDLLPLTIQQIDLQESVNTNAELERILTLPENDSYSVIPLGINSSSLFGPFKTKGIRVLLDCGALILELSNDQVAHEWLQADNSIEAVVYFNKNNVLTVKSRQGEDKPFELSPFRKRLNVCAVYLDDEHTRGTDITLPHGYKACVTLGSGLTKDKMVQACMRMRLLGKGHTVSFWASHEANIKIEELASQKLLGIKKQSRVQNVMEWVKQNSREFLEDGLIYWTAASINYARKATAENHLVAKGMYDKSSLNLMAKQCLENEVIDLLSMYGEVKNERKFVDMIPQWFKAARSNMFEATSSVIFDETSSLVIQRCANFIPNRTKFLSQMDEEHEKEIEEETEEEKEISRPAAATPALPKLSGLVKTIILSGDLQLLRNTAGQYQNCKDVLPLPMALKSVEKIWNLTKDIVDCWGSQTYVTNDFVRSVNAIYGQQCWNDIKMQKSGDFLRPPTWLVAFGSGEDQSFLLISPHEANEMYHKFRSGNTATSLMMYNPRFLPSQKVLADNPKLSLPPLRTIFNKDYVLAPLFLFSGSLFFSCEEEQRAMAECLGQDMKNYDKTMMFAYGIQRKISSSSSNLQFQFSMNFRTIPAPLIKEILLVRHQASVPLNSHMARLVFDGTPKKIGEE